MIGFVKEKIKWEDKDERLERPRTVKGQVLPEDISCERPTSPTRRTTADEMTGLLTREQGQDEVR
jgi:hypothetical protein